MFQYDNFHYHQWIWKFHTNECLNRKSENWNKSVDLDHLVENNVHYDGNTSYHKSTLGRATVCDIIQPYNYSTSILQHHFTLCVATQHIHHHNNQLIFPQKPYTCTWSPILLSFIHESYCQNFMLTILTYFFHDEVYIYICYMTMMYHVLCSKSVIKEYNVLDCNLNKQHVLPKYKFLVQYLRIMSRLLWPVLIGWDNVTWPDPDLLLMDQCVDQMLGYFVIKTIIATKSFINWQFLFLKIMLNAWCLMLDALNDALIDYLKMKTA